MADKDEKRLQEPSRYNLLSSAGRKEGATAELAEFELWTKRLEIFGRTGAIAADKLAAVQAPSELDVLMIDALANLKKMPDNNPRLMMILSSLKCETREGAAKKIAEKRLKDIELKKNLDIALPLDEANTLVKERETARATPSAASGLGGSVSDASIMAFLSRLVGGAGGAGGAGAARGAGE
jgi:hypothetical protein